TPTTPTGCRYTRHSLPGTSEGRIWPSTRYGANEASSITACTADHSSSALMRVLPDSVISQSTISSWRFSITPAALRMTAERSAGSISAHAFCAFCAPRCASSRSRSSACGISMSVSPVYGLRSVSRPFALPALHSPAIGWRSKPENRLALRWDCETETMRISSRKPLHALIYDALSRGNWQRNSIASVSDRLDFAARDRQCYVRRDVSKRGHRIGHDHARYDAEDVHDTPVEIEFLAAECFGKCLL